LRRKKREKQNKTVDTKSIDKSNIASKPASNFNRVYIRSEKTERGETNTTETQKKASKQERKKERKKERERERESKQGRATS
jgi:hypothetical protein